MYLRNYGKKAKIQYDDNEMQNSLQLISNANGASVQVKLGLNKNIVEIGNLHSKS